MSLGSIAHVQYYFARTGLLDGKGAQMAKKREKELRNLDTDFLSAMDINRGRRQASSASQASRASSMGSSPDLGPTGGMGDFVASPIETPSHDGEEWEFYADEEDPDMLPPTVSTYNDKPKPIPRPPTLSELKDDLKRALEDAAKALADAKRVAPVPNLASASAATESKSHLRSPSKAADFDSPSRRRSESDATLLTGMGEGPVDPNEGWYELQGVHILDIITLAIRAARKYYTAHDNPVRLSSIKSERKIRAELLGVMEVLRKMAIRNFKSGMRREETETMEKWVEGVFAMLAQEEAIEAKEAEERRSWVWLDDLKWPAYDDDEPNKVREMAFLQSLDEAAPEESKLPLNIMSKLDADPPVASPFLAFLQGGVRLIELHNAAVKKSKRPFGSIPTFHTDTRKPYRMAENLKYWIKAAELRWEVILKVDVSGVVHGDSGEAWKGFEKAIFLWSETVRKEIIADIKNEEERKSNEAVRPSLVLRPATAKGSGS